MAFRDMDILRRLRQLRNIRISLRPFKSRSVVGARLVAEEVGVTVRSKWLIVEQGRVASHWLINSD